MLQRPTHLSTRFAVVALFLLIPPAAIAGGSSEPQRLVDEATVTFERFLETPGIAAWYRSEAKNVKGVFIVPQFLRGAFIVGAASGSGVLLARDFVKGGWSPPAFYRMSAGSFGFQAGADASQVVLIIQSFSALERFYGSGTAKLGLDAGLTFGTIGEGGTTGFDIVSFSWSKGLFGGMSVEGLAITTAGSDNEAYYGAPVKPEEILSNGSVTNPGADTLRTTVERLILRIP
ncbi:MAG TPA: lipid-binding SYLF domain-containing protein [Nitrospiraceae bacterium]|nr:lipid-binding SYLF domain-containing protein [Nitrospiraceae bacterium]